MMSNDRDYARCIELARPRPARATARLALRADHALARHEPEWAELAEVPAFNSLGGDGADEYVAVLDTGVERSTAALHENWAAGVSTIPGDNYFWRGGYRTDSFFHGTATAGIVAQTMPRVRLVALKCFDQRPARFARRNDAAWWVEAIEWLHGWQERRGIRGVVVNVSMGLAPGRARRGSAAWTKAWQDVRALERAIARSVDEFGNVYCAAAANDGQRGSPAAYPAAFDGLVLAVGSIRLARASGSDGGFLVELSEFSNTNAYVDFVCPGEDIWTFLPARTARAFRWAYRGAISTGAVRVQRVRYGQSRQWLVELDGTSFASPALAGMVAGLLGEYKRAHDGRLPTTAEIRRVLTERSERFVDPTGRTWLVPTMLAGGNAILSGSDNNDDQRE
jgi:subtilisin family serine protease